MNRLLEKKENEHNKKIKNLFTTEKGFQYYRIKGLSKTEVETIFCLLQRIRKNTKKLGICKKAKQEKLLII